MFFSVFFFAGADDTIYWAGYDVITFYADGREIATHSSNTMFATASYWKRTDFLAFRIRSDLIEPSGVVAVTTSGVVTDRFWRCFQDNNDQPSNSTYTYTLFISV